MSSSFKKSFTLDLKRQSDSPRLISNASFKLDRDNSDDNRNWRKIATLKNISAAAFKSGFQCFQERHLMDSNSFNVENCFKQALKRRIPEATYFDQTEVIEELLVIYNGKETRYVSANKVKSIKVIDRGDGRERVYRSKKNITFSPTHFFYDFAVPENIMKSNAPVLWGNEALNLILHLKHGRKNHHRNNMINGKLNRRNG